MTGVRVPPAFGKAGRLLSFFVTDARGAACLLALLLLWGWSRWGWQGRPDYIPRDEHVNAGELLLHGLPGPAGSVNCAMPLTTVADAVYHDHLPAGARRALGAALWVLFGLLVFSLGSLLHSRLCGLLAAAAAFGSGALEPWSPGGMIELEYELYTVGLLGVAQLCVWWARSPTPARGALLGAALALSLMLRSPLLLLPFFLTVFLWFRRRGAPVREMVAATLPLWAVPLLALVPWMWLNWALDGVPRLSEAGRGYDQLAAGVLGLTTPSAITNELNPQKVAQGGAVLSWAAAELLRHPWVFLRGWAIRVWEAAAPHPGLLLLGAWAAFFFRRRPGHAALALLAAYLLALHTAIICLPYYLWPVWPLVLVLGASLAAHALRPAEEGDARPSFVLALLLPAGLVGAGALALAAAYPLRLEPSVDRLALALARHPGDVWLRAERGRRRLAAGDGAGAAEDLCQAMRLDPRSMRRLDCAAARFIADEGGADILDPASLSGIPALRRGYLLVAIARALRERPDAGEALRMARELGRGAPLEPAALRASSRFRIADQDLAPELGELFGRLAPKHRERLLRKLLEPKSERLVFTTRERCRLVKVQAGLGSRELAVRAIALLDAGPRRQIWSWDWLELSRSLSEGGLRDMVPEVLGRAEAADPGDVERAEAAEQWGELLRHAEQDPASGKSLLTAMLRHPYRGAAAEDWLRVAQAALQAGDPALARAALARTGGKDSGGGDPMQEAELLLRLGPRPRAQERLRSLVEAPPAGARPRRWLDVCEAARAAGFPELMPGLLRLTGASGPDGAEKRDLLRLADAFLESSGADPRGLLTVPAPALPAGFWLRLGQECARRGESGPALEAYERSLAGAPAPPVRAETARSLALAREPRRAVAAARPLLRRSSGPVSALLWPEVAYAARDIGDREALLSILDNVPWAEGDAAGRIRAATLYAENGTGKQGAALLRHVLEGRAGDPAPALWLEAAVAARLAGESELAAQALARVRPGSLTNAERRRLAVLLQEAGDYASAIRILDALVAAEPAQAGHWSARGVLKSISGQPDGAVADLRRAVAIDPRAWDAVLSLGGILVGLGKADEARALYDSAVAAAGEGREDPRLRRILEARQELGGAR